MPTSDVETDLVAVPGSGARHGRRTAHLRRRSERRRPGMLLGALLAGGLAAGVVGLHGTASASSSAPTSVADARGALLADGDDGSADEMPQASITEAEAQVRLQQVAASRAARQAAAAAASAPRRPSACCPPTGP